MGAGPDEAEWNIAMAGGCSARSGGRVSESFYSLSILRVQQGYAININHYHLAISSFVTSLALRLLCGCKLRPNCLPPFQSLLYRFLFAPASLPRFLAARSV